MSGNKQAEKIRTKLHRERPLAHPIKEHPVDSCEEYVQKLYIDMLCVIAGYENEDTEFALNFVQRIMAGAELTEPVTEHVKNAMEITEERFDEFMRQCKENKLENIFIVDSLLISCANGEPNAKQVDFITEISEALCVKKNALKVLAGLAGAILAQDSDIYHEVHDTIPKDDKYNLVMEIVCYLKEFVQGVLIDCDDLFWVYFPQKTEYTLPEGVNGLGHENCHTIIFENVVIGKPLYGYGADSVTITNCELPYASILNVREFNIKNCEFNGYGEQQYFYYVSDRTAINIDHSTFKDYCYENFEGSDKINHDPHNWSDGVGYNTVVTASFCRFININAKDHEDYWVFGEGKNIHINHSEFINCQGYALFGNNCDLTDNTYRGCSPVTK